MNKHPWRYVSRSRVAEYMGASVSTVVRLEKDGVLHPARIGGRVYFDLAEIDRVMKARSGQNERAVRR